MGCQSKPRSDKNMQQIKNVIWDWNGTILNDIELCINCINVVLRERNIPELTYERYIEIFGFPVKDYYERAGLNFANEPFEIPAKQFIDLYHNNWSSCSVFTDATKALKHFQDKGIKQFVLSAMEHNALQKQTNHFGVDGYFNHIQGIDNHFAESKLQTGKNLMQQFNINAQETLFIGDTTHDFEVAQQLGVQCVLVAKGHQNFNILKRATTNVYKSLLDFIYDELN